MTDFQKNALFLGMVVSIVLIELSALFIYVWDSIHSIPAPGIVTDLLATGVTFVVTLLSHQQGAFIANSLPSVPNK